MEVLQMSLSLFDISMEFYALKDLMEDEFDQESGELINKDNEIIELFDNLKLTMEDKFDNCQRYCLTLDGEADILDKEIKRLSLKKQALNNKKDRLKNLMQNAMIVTGLTKFKTSLYSFNIKDSESLEVLDIDNIPREFLRIKKEADKTAIKKAIKDDTPKLGFEYKYKDDNERLFVLVSIADDEYVLAEKGANNEKFLYLEDLQRDFDLVKGFEINGCKIVKNKSLVVR
jgi:phage host-nuclease inhibitor protein Gam